MYALKSNVEEKFRRQQELAAQRRAPGLVAAWGSRALRVTA